MEVSEAKRLKERERENTELKEDAGRKPAQEPSAGGGVRKKVISPEQRRRAARAVVASELCSGRAEGRVLKVSRSTYWYRSKEPTSQGQRLLKRMRELSEKHGRYGYRRIAALLRQEGWPVDVLWVSTGFFVGVIDMAVAPLGVLDFQDPGAVLELVASVEFRVIGRVGV